MGVWIESKYKVDHCDTAFKVLSQGKSLTAMCAEIGIARETMYVWKDKYPDFAMAIKLGLQKCQALKEEQGEKGIEGEIKGFSAPAWIFTMKNRFRQDYADQDCLTLASQNERMKAELEELRKELDAKHKKDY